MHLFTLLTSAALLGILRVSGTAVVKNFSTWTPGNFLTNVLLVHSWRPYCIDSWNNASWSVSCEWFAYLVFPLLIWCRLSRLPAPATLASVLLLPAVPAVLAQTQLGPPCEALIKVLCEFSAGCLVYHIYAGQRKAALNERLMTRGAVGASLVMLVALWTEPSVTPGWLALVFPFFILAVARSSGTIGRILGIETGLVLGTVSYSLYMTHNVTLWVLKAFAPVTPNTELLHRTLLLILYFGSIGVIAALTYHGVEEPARRFIRRCIEAGLHQGPRPLLVDVEASLATSND